MSSRPRQPAYLPEVGEVVEDLAVLDADGQPKRGAFMESRGGEYYLRSEGGGCEWTTLPAKVRPLDPPCFIKVQHPSEPRTADIPIGDVA
ncbi:hypothetical protein [Kitasatospora sp. MBT66]|uniref:hypothetical protein n=1 Tax=Kitasatospora sp. MBT66 TaxID=1444769 RepID=UPI0005BE221B|nr:hypothetical protein [Kitasatospora sp. MBT66]